MKNQILSKFNKINPAVSTGLTSLTLKGTGKYLELSSHDAIIIRVIVMRVRDGWIQNPDLFWRFVIMVQFTISLFVGMIPRHSQ